MPAPLLSAYAERAWNLTGTSGSSGTISWNSGDLVVVMALTEDASCTVSVANQLGLTWANGGAIGTAGSTCFANSWSAVATSNQSGVTVAATASDNTHQWGIAVWVFSSHNGIGARATGITTAKTVSLTRAGDNSLVVGVQGDYSAAASTGYSFTPTVANDRQHAQSAGRYTYYVSDWPDQGAAGTQSYGTSGETSSGTFAKIALEIKGAAGGGGSFVPPRLFGATAQGPLRAVYQPWLGSTPDVSLSPVSASDAAAVSELTTDLLIISSNVDSSTLTEGSSSIAATLTTTDSGTLSDSSSSAEFLAVSDSGTLSDSSSVVQSLAVSAVDSWTLSDSSSLVQNTAISGVDSWTLTDGTPSIAATLATSDSGTLSDGTPSGTATLATSDSETFSDSSSVTQTGNNPNASDTQTQSEGSTSIAATLTTSDSWALAEGSTTALDALSRVDSETLSDSSSVQQQLSRSDSSTMSDASVPQLLLKLLVFDSSALSELAQRISSGGTFGWVHSWIGGASVGDAENARGGSVSSAADARSGSVQSASSARGGSVADNAGSMNHGGTIQGS